MPHLKFIGLLALTLSASLTMLVSSINAAEAPAAPTGGGRMMAVSLEAQVIEIDHETREVSLRGPQGNIVTLTAGDHVERLHDIAVGDIVTTTYIASIEGELREPTEEEIAAPWVELEGVAVASDEIPPGAIVGRTIRAVCTIEGLNRLLGTITIKDSRGRYHVIGDVEAEKMEGVTLGQTLVLVYSEAIAMTLEKKQIEDAE